MPAKQRYLTSLHKSFSTFLTQNYVYGEISRQAESLYLKLLGWKTDYTRWSIDEVRQFLTETQMNTSVLPQVQSLLTQFVKDFPPHQANVFLHEYLLAIKQDGCSSATVRNYRSDIRQFVRFSQTGQLKTLFTKPKLAEFVTYQLEKGLKESSITRKLSSIAQFGWWLQAEGLLTQDLRWIDQASVQSLSGAKISTVVEKPKTSSITTQFKPGVKATKPALGQNQRFGLKKRLRELTNSVKQVVPTQTRRWLLPYLNLAFIALVFIGLGYFGYRQLFVETTGSLAYPSAPTRPNRVLSFQGRLTDSAQNPLTTSTNMRFYLYDAVTGGSSLWDSTTCAVTPDQDGIFTVNLGDGCGSEITQDVFSENANIWLEALVEAETLTPRQPIRTVAYALNAETVQGYPIDSSGSATVNTILTMNDVGDIVLGEVSPKIRAVSGTFTLEGEALTLTTVSGSDGDITFSPDGLGGVISDAYFSAPGATLSATYAGGTALILKAGPTATANIMEWQDSGGTALGVIDESGNVGIGTAAPGYALDIVYNADEQFRVGRSSSKYTAIRDDVLLFHGMTSNGIRIQTDDASDIHFRPNGATAVTVKDGGNLGVGTTNPLFLLDVAGTASVNSLNINDAFTFPTADGTTNYILQTNGSGTVSWTDPAGAAASAIYWDTSLGALYPKNSTMDLLIGGQATSSAKFAVLNVNDGTPTASVSAGVAGATYLTADGTLQTTANQLLTLGGSTTGNIYLNGNVGVGTNTPTQALDVNGSIQADSFYDSANNAYFLDPAATGDSLTVAGNVGVGTISPAYSIDVFGDTTAEAINSRVGFNIDTIPAPPNTFTGAAVSGSGLEIGQYHYHITYYSNIGETNASSVISATTTSGNQQIDLSSIPTSSDSTVVGRKIYRGKVGESTSYGALVGTIADNTTTTHSDTYPDSSITGSILTRNITAKPNTTSNFISLNDTRALVLDNNLTAVGVGAGASITNAPQSVFVGQNAGNKVTSGAGNTLVGHNVGDSITTGTQNMGYGPGALGALTTGSYNNAIGWGTLDTGTAISHNTSIGYGSGAGLSSGNYNVAIGNYSGDAAGTRSYNTLLGVYSGSALTSGSSNVFLGYNSGSKQTTNSNLFIIDNQLRADAATEQTNSILYGVMAATPGSQSLRINAVPSINGAYTLPIVDGTADYVLTTDGAGAASWGDPAGLAASAIYWDTSLGALYPKNSTMDLLIGGQATSSAKFAVLNVNDGTPVASVSAGVAGASYLTADGTLQTTANQLLTLGGSTTGDIYLNGNVGVGTAAPGSSLHVNGDIRIPNGNRVYFDNTNDYNYLDFSSGFLTIGYTADAIKFDVNASTTKTIEMVANSNFQIKGANNKDIYLTPQGTGNVGVGTVSPLFLLDVAGTASVNSLNINDEYTFPTADGTTDYILQTDGGGAVTWIDPNTITGAGLFANTLNVLHPKNELASIVDLVVGGTSTASAKFQVFGDTGNITSQGNADFAGTLTAGTANAFNVDASGNIDAGTWTADTIGVGYGGTGLASYTIGDLIYADGTTSLAKLADITTGNVLLSGGVSTAPSWGKVTLGTHTTGNYVSSLAGTANQITASAATGDVTLSLPSDLRAPGTLNAVSGLYTGATAGTQRITAAGNLTNIGTTQLNGETYTWPGSQTTDYVLQTNGSGTLSWVDAAGAAAGSIPWIQNDTDGTIYPKNSTVDLLIGGQATSSAKFAVLNVNDGTPVASVSAGVAGATYLTADGTLQTTANQLLTLGGSTTGDIYLNGNVGVGTTSPEQILNIVDTSNPTNDGSVIIEGRADGNPNVLALRARDLSAPTSALPANQGPVLRWQGFDGTSFGDMAAIMARSESNLGPSDHGGYLTFHTVDDATTTLDERMRIANNGNVGIGTDATPDYLLDVQGTFRADSAASFGNNVAITGDLTITGDDLYMSTNTANYFLMADGTNYNPTSPADVRTGLGLVAGGTGDIWVEKGGDSMVGTLTFSAVTTDITTGTNEHLSLMPNGIGNVGIGTTNPLFLLDVAGTASVNSLNINDAFTLPTADGTTGYILQTNGSGAVSWADPALAGAGSVHWSASEGAIYPKNSTMDLLIGGQATSSAKFAVLNVNDGTPVASVSAGVSGTSAYLTADGILATTNMTPLTLGGSTTGPIQLSPKGTTGLYVDDTGNVGIGTTSPGAYALNVSGNAYVGGTLTTTGAITAPTSTNTINSLVINSGALSSVTGYSQASGDFTYNSSAGQFSIDSDAFDVTDAGLVSGATGISSSGNIDLDALNAGGIVKAAVTTGRLSIATAGTDYENPLTFSNGLTRTVDAVKLGGALTATTDIPLAGFDMTFSGSGSVGIGVTDPDTKLEVFNAGDQLKLSFDATDNAVFAVDTNGVLTITPSGASVSFADKNLINVGDIALDSLSSDGTTITVGNGTTNNIVLTDNTTIAVSLGSDAGDDFTIDGTTLVVEGDNNRVGIGTATPLFTLDVAGTTSVNSLNINDAFTLPTADGTTGYILQTNGGGAVSWADPALAGAGSVHWSASEGAIYPKNSTMDLLIGGQATSSAKFAVLNMTEGTPVASVSAGVAGATYLTADGTLQTTANQLLTLGGSTTGNIYLNGNVGIGTATPLFNLDVAGTASVNSLNINDAYTLPTADGTTDYVLQTNGSGTVTWNTLGAASITDDSLDYAQFQDTMDLDANLILNQTAYTWTQNFTGTTTNGYTYNANSLTSGSGIALASTATGLTGNLQSITLSGSNAANTGSVLGIDNTGTANTNTSLYIKHYATGTNNLAFRVDDVSGDTTPFVINGDGNVGIGTTSPLFDLDVIGNASISGTLSQGPMLQVDAGACNVSSEGKQYYDAEQNKFYYCDGSTWTALGSGSGAAGMWQESLGSIAPNNSTWDVLLGGTATSSAKFAFTNINSGTPTFRSADATALNITGNAASIWNTTAGDLTLSADAASVNINANEAAADQIKLSAAGTIAGNAININTTNGGVAISAAGATNGDVTITSGDDTTITATGLLSLTGGTGSILDFTTFDINSSGIISMIDSVAHTIEDIAGNLSLTSDSGITSIVGDLYVSSGISTFGTAVSDGTIEATKFCTGDGETNCVTDFSSITSPWTDAGSYMYPTAGEVLGNSASAGANKIAGIYLADSAPLTFGLDNDISFSFSGTELATSLGTNTWNIANNLLFLNGSSSLIGIGTNNPLATLDIRSTLGTVPTASISGNTSMATLIVDQSGSGDIFAASSSGLTRFVVTGNGNVGIGVQNPSSKLEIGGSTSTISNDSGDITINAASNFISLAGDSLGNLLDLSIAGDASISGAIAFDGVSPSTIDILNGNRLDFQTSPGGDAGLAVVMSILNNGNVGLGTTTPTQVLDINGSIQTDSIFDSANNSYFLDPAATGNSLIVAGNIGIGTTSPLFDLDIIGNASISGTLSQGPMLQVDAGTCNISSEGKQYYDAEQNKFYYCNGTAWTALGSGSGSAGMWQESNGAISQLNHTWDVLIGNVATASAMVKLSSNSGGDSFFNSGGNVGIGDTTPTQLLDVNGSIQAAIFYDKADNNYYLDPASTGTSLATAGDIDIAGGTGKLDVGTIDPPFTINGEKYATYVSSMTGVKEETTGLAYTNEYVAGKGYRYTIDFTNQPEGSDLWLFSKVANLKEQMSEVIVLLSPAGNTRAWYTLDTKNHQLSIYSSQPTHISYRLTAPRFDADTWSNYRSNDIVGFILEDPDAWELNLGGSIFGDLANAISEVFNTIVAQTAQIEKVITPTIELQPDVVNEITAEIEYATLEITDSNSNTVAEFNSQGDLTLLGELNVATISARSARIDQLEARMAELEHIKAQTAELVDATISGTLYATRIDGLDDQLAETLNESSFLDKLLGKKAEATESASLASLFTIVEDAGYATDSGSLIETPIYTGPSSDVSLVASSVFINDYFSVNGSGYVAQQLGVGEQLLVGNSLAIGDNYIEYQPINIEDPRVLHLQPSGQGTLSLMAGLMTLHDNGQILIDGDLAVAGDLEIGGTLLTDLIEPTAFGDSLQIKLATTSGEIAGAATGSANIIESRLEILGISNIPTATISAQGRASFDGGINIGTEDLTPISTMSATIASKQPSGKATIRQNTLGITIKSALITKNSLIYVSPIGSTGNQILYVKSQTPEDPSTLQQEGGFSVGFDVPISNNATFNWWIIN